MAKIGLNFGKQADNLLRQGAAASTTAAVGASAVGGAVYEGAFNDGSYTGGAMQGAMLGGAAKFGSNMYRTGAGKNSANSNFQLSNFTNGWKKTEGRRLDMGFAEMSSFQGANTPMKNIAPPALPTPQSASKQLPIASAPSAPRTSGAPFQNPYSNAPAASGIDLRSGRPDKISREELDGMAEVRARNAQRRNTKQIPNIAEGQRLLQAREGNYAYNAQVKAQRGG